MLVRGMLGVLLGGGLLQCGCGCGPDRRCPDYTFEPASASSAGSELSVAEGDGEPEPMGLVPSDAAQVPGTCWATVRVPGPGGCFVEGEDAWEHDDLSFGCTINDQYSVQFETPDIGDLREQGAGTTYETEDWLHLHYIHKDPGVAQVEATARPGCMQIVVEEAVGGPAPYPDVVSDDYLRVLRIEVDCEVPVNDPIYRPVSVVGHATIIISAENYAPTSYMVGC